MRQAYAAWFPLLLTLHASCGDLKAQPSKHTPKKVAVPNPAAATPPATRTRSRDQVEATPPTSASIGAPHDGSLRNGKRLPRRTVGLYSNPKRPNRNGDYATPEVIAALVHAGKLFARKHPDARIVINDLSLPGGGKIPHHGSHQSGRDADILMMLLDDKGNPRAPKGVPIEPDGTGVDYQNLSKSEDDVPVRLDVKRTWDLVEALLRQTHSPVQRIFVVEHIRSMLATEATRASTPKLVRRFEQVTCQPSHPHDDHLHVRFFCDTSDIEEGCEDTYPIYPWHKRRLRKQGLSPNRARPSRRKKKPKRTQEPSTDHMHPDVHAFLERRKAWKPKPHPGRMYCR